MLVPVNFNWTENGIAVLDVERIDPATWKRTTDQNLKVGDYFTFVESNILVDGLGNYGDGGYFWTRHGEVLGIRIV